MRMPIDKIPMVVSDYFSTEILPKSGEGLMAFGTAFVGGYAVRNAEAMIRQYLPVATSLGIVDGENKIDIDALYEVASTAIKEHPFMILGYKADQSDVEALRNIMTRYGE